MDILYYLVIVLFSNKLPEGNENYVYTKAYPQMCRTTLFIIALTTTRNNSDVLQWVNGKTNYGTFIACTTTQQ